MTFSTRVVLKKFVAHDTPNLSVSPLATVVAHKVRIINDLSFEVQKNTKRED